MKLIEMRQPFFSMTSGFIYIFLGILFGAVGGTNQTIEAGGLTIGGSALWGIAGLMFIMSYFSIVHLQKK